nr:ankyrin repeat-containing protein [Tanacetum cinerariifolium]
MGTNQRGEREHRGAGTNQAGDKFMYHRFEHRMRKLKMPLFEGEAYLGIDRVKDEIHSILRMVIKETVMEVTFTKGLKHALRTAVKVMNPEGAAVIVGQTTSKGDNFQRMTELEIQDRKAKGLCFRCEEKYTPGHQCASRTFCCNHEPDATIVFVVEAVQNRMHDVIDDRPYVEAMVNVLNRLAPIPKTLSSEGIDFLNRCLQRNPKKAHRLLYYLNIHLCVNLSLPSKKFLV